MNYGRGFPLPQYGNKESWIAVKVIPPENNGVGPNPGSWTAAMFGGQFPQGVESLGETPRRGVVVDDGIIRPRESESWMTTPVRSTGNGIRGQRDSWTTIHHGNGNGNGNGFVQNDGIWNPVIHTNSYSRGNGNVNGNASGSSSWTPVTPGKPNLQTSNVITANKPRNQMGNEDWGDLVGMYQGLLQKEPLNLNEVAQDHYQNNEGQSRVSSTPNKNFNPILNSAHVPNTMHNLPTTPNKNFDPILNSAHVPNTKHNLPTTPNKSFNPILNSTHVPSTMHNLPSMPNKNFNLILNSTPVPNTMHSLPSTPNKNFNQILNSVPVPNTIHNLNPNHGSNQASSPVSYFPSEDPANWDCGLLAAIVRPKASPISDPFKTRPQSNSVHDLNKTPAQNSFIQGGSMLGNHPSPTFSQKDGFPVPCRPCYDLNSPPRSELDAVSSRITGSLPFAPITPDTQRKDRDESQRIEDGDNHRIGDSTSSAVSTTQKEHLVCEEGDELGIDLNKTPNQKTPARRKKHRPKVIREGKPKRTQTQTPKDPNRVKRKYVRKVPLENGVEKSPNGKRKYVRKKVVDQSDSQPKTEEVKSSKPVVETPTKSCRRQLNFDSEHVAIDDSQNIETQGINLKNNLQDIEQERRINSILERSAMNAAQNNMHAGLMTRQESVKTGIQSELNGPSTPMPKVRDHAVNVLARNLTMRNRYNQVGPVCIDLEGGEPNGQTVDERRGVKRPSLEHINPRNLNAMDSLYMYQKLLLGGDSRVDRSDDLTRVIESHKKTKMQSDLSIPCPEHNSIGDLRRPVYGNVSAMQLVNSCAKKVTNPSYQVNERHFQSPTPAATRNLQTHSGSSGMRPIVDISRRSTQDHVNLITAMVSWNQAPATPPKDYSRSPVVTSPATLMEKKRTTIQYSPSQRSNGPHNTPPQLCNDASRVHQISFTKPKGAGRPRKQKGGSLIEDITRMLEGLCIYEEKRNALVPYRGDNNAIIPFEPVRKRKPRPKVDLDPETDRLWRLLMGNEGSEAAEAMDKDKEKWWEEERRVFRGRADSFIARMHLVQGDRRFSRWKGSVVDSVIGVFLTQNVSDHLSSSAFMSLAARFNPKTRSTNETRCEDGACVLVEEPLETILPTDKISKQPVFSERPFVSDMRHNRNIISSTNYAINKQNNASEELILSQDSLDSSTIQAIDESRSSAGSNSEAEDQTFGFETSKVPEKVTMFKELFSHDNWTTPLNNRSQYTHQLPKTPRDFGLLGGENISLPSTKSGITYQQKVPSQGPAKPAIGAQNLCGEDAGPEASSKEPNYGSHDPLNRQTNNIPKGRKGISEDEKKKAFDWDSLRRDVLLNGEKKERSKDATDSLDYEALRRAHVNEISDAIRERGMNNLLADRIKDFLDRLVRDHGSIDLEWLRDAPPDKAKDYLLSIRGLGLKSVECVRLLTLHHLAFPVDTNVGRIAVRLGWVPLQPLPESLQLHLLEMYPVLESIQKYLWPRLCKLDQLTLYELHYQILQYINS